MLVRMVKMGFYKQNVEVFLEHFNANKSKIRAFEGCHFLELYRDKKDPSIFFTYSFWDSEEDLLNYKKSELFLNIWGNIKPLFSIRPEAWSVDKMDTLD